MGDTLPDKKLILPLLVVGFATYVVLIGLAFLLPRYLPVKLSDRGIYSFMLAFGNVGFIGYPIVASIFGASAENL
jgi:predicted permease